MFNLLANREVDDIETVPPDFRLLYKDRGDGVHIHNETMEPVIKAIGGMQGVNAKLRTDVDNAKKSKVDLSLLKDFGETPEAIAESVKAKIAELESQAGGKSKIDLDKARLEIQTAADRKVQEIEGREGKMRSSLDRYLVRSQAAVAIAGEKGDAELLMPFVNQRLKVVQEGDDYRTVVVDDAGNTRLDPATGQELSVGQLVKEFKADKRYGRLFESEQANGGGSTPNNQRGGQVQDARISTPRPQLSATQKISEGLRARGN